jgi:para-nitrobenzyl esterase
MTAKSLSIEGGAVAIPEPDVGGVRVYKGIPYAAPPLGRLRWRPPEPVPAWTGVKPSNAFGPNSLQRVVWDDIDPFAVGISEDCLNLNVWTPAAPGDRARLSTMVWIHGGGLSLAAERSRAMTARILRRAASSS